MKNRYHVSSNFYYYSFSYRMMIINNLSRVPRMNWWSILHRNHINSFYQLYHKLSCIDLRCLMWNLWQVYLCWRSIHSNILLYFDALCWECIPDSYLFVLASRDDQIRVPHKTNLEHIFLMPIIYTFRLILISCP